MKLKLLCAHYRARRWATQAGGTSLCLRNLLYTNTATNSLAWYMYTISWQCPLATPVPSLPPRQLLRCQPATHWISVLGDDEIETIGCRSLSHSSTHALPPSSSSSPPPSPSLEIWATGPSLIGCCPHVHRHRPSKRALQSFFDPLMACNHTIRLSKDMDSWTRAILLLVPAGHRTRGRAHIWKDLKLGASAIVTCGYASHM